MDTMIAPESTHDADSVNDETIAIEAHWLAPFAKIAIEALGESEPALYVLIKVDVWRYRQTALNGPTAIGGDRNPLLLSPVWSRTRARKLHEIYVARAKAHGFDPDAIQIATVHGEAPTFIRACLDLTCDQVRLALAESREIVHVPRALADAWMRFIPAMDQPWADCDPFSELSLAFWALKEAMTVEVRA